MAKSILFVGSNPSQASQSTSAFDTDTKSWATLTGWIDTVGIAVTSFENISKVKTPNNRPLNSKEIDEGIAKLKLVLPQFTHIVALGKTASKALTKYNIKHLEMPHPSGLNRQLNDRTYVAQQIEKLRDYWNGPG